MKNNINNTFKEDLKSINQLPVITLLSQISLFKDRYFPASKTSYSSIESLILNNGVVFSKTSSVPSFFNSPNQCFKNSFLNILFNPSLSYTEGYTIINDALVFHSWCIDHQKCVLDPTLSNAEHYIGISFQNQFVIKYAQNTGFLGILDRPIQTLKFLETSLPTLNILMYFN